MNRHQVLTGAVNPGDHTCAVGSVEGVHFTAYACGCNIVILASDFQRVQIIPGATHGNIQISCIDCSTDSGKIAASYGDYVCIFEPTPLLHQDSSHKLDYQWYQTGHFRAECPVVALSWNMEGSRILTGGEVIQMWQVAEQQTTTHQGTLIDGVGVAFYIESDSGATSAPAVDSEIPHWQCVWHCRPASPITQLKYSPDGALFATVGKADRLVKIWYENKKVQFPMARNDSLSPKKEEISYSFIYIAHPRAVTGFFWRKTSKYMPRGSVANMLITSCRDNICRVWCETLLPDDGLVDSQQFDSGSSQTPLYQIHSHKHRFLHKLNHARHLLHKRKHNMNASLGVPSLPSMHSPHDLHRFGVYANNLSPGFHFHLAASINPETDIPLLPAVQNKHATRDAGFVVHWLNNKELHFTLEAERILDELSSLATTATHSESGHDGEDHVTQPSGVTMNGDLDDHSDVDGDEAGEEATMPPRGASMPDMRDHPSRRRGGSRMLLRRKSKLSDTTSEGSVSQMSSMQSLATESTIVPEHQTKGCMRDALDHKIEQLLRDWHRSSDMLFSIHPVDGSFLVWLVDWLDEYIPGSYRQSQISFSSRIPRAFPVGDAMTMSPHLLLYCNYHKMDVKKALKEAENKKSECAKPSQTPTANAMGKNSPGQSDNTLMPNVIMLSKHSNGSLNQWQISFAEASKFATVLSIAHASRACGHRFQTNSASCHPVLPLLVTTSHHNVPHDVHYNKAEMKCENSTRPPLMGSRSVEVGPRGFCSELILWRVDPVGPLSKSGGIAELARINSPIPSAFSNVAWLPTLLPSSILGTSCNSPSALFVASDGECLRVYQSVIDARSILTEYGTDSKVEVLNMSHSTSSSSEWVTNAAIPPPCSRELNIVSLQSTAHPGCIIELETIADAKQDWQHIQLIHVFQDQLVTGQKWSECNVQTGQTNLEAMVDLRNVSIFEEHFYLVVVGKLRNGRSVLHMWRIVISSQGGGPGIRYTPDTNFFQDSQLVDIEGDLLSSHSESPSPTIPSFSQQQSYCFNTLDISSTKVCSHLLDIPEGIEVVEATPAAGHLSSASIYPACFAPYLVSTACSDGRVRFWRCKVEAGSECEEGIAGFKFEWVEWEMLLHAEGAKSSIRVHGKPIAVSCAFSGRVAVSYRSGNVRVDEDKPENKFINLCVSIYECESTGGSEWTLEDTIELKNIILPDIKSNIDLGVIYNNDNLKLSGVGLRKSCENLLDEHVQHMVESTWAPRSVSPSSSSGLANVVIPSPQTIQSVKRSLNSMDSLQDVLQQKHLVQLDWVSTEDGAHILTVAVGSKILLYAAVSSEIAQATKRENKLLSKPRPTRGYLQKSKSVTVQNVVEEIRWMKLRSIELTTADGLPPLPMHISWVRDGILVVGMDNEVHVYSQWRGAGEGLDSLTDSEGSQEGDIDTRSLTEDRFLSASSASLSLAKRNASFSRLSHSSSSILLTPSASFIGDLRKETTKKQANMTEGKKSLMKEDSISSLHLLQDCGLFEAAQLAHPVLPQYHPKQLLELLNFGKIRRVKAILAHLVRCIAGQQAHHASLLSKDESFDGGRPRTFSRPRALSVAGPASPMDSGVVPSEDLSDSLEIKSIPPLPIYALLAADQEKSSYLSKKDENSSKNGQNQEYNALFGDGSFDDENNDFSDVFDSDEDDDMVPKRRERRSSSVGHGHINPKYFGPAQSGLLSRYLTRTQLPGLSSLDQMYLLALADTVANTRTDLSGNEAPDVAVRNVLAREQNQTNNVPAESVDDCGIRYMLAMRHYVYLCNTMPLAQRQELQMQGLSPAYFVWAFHSESEEELLNMVPSYQKGEPTWQELKQFGAGWWLRNINTLRKCIEKVAKTAFQANKDPLDCALFYLAMKKKMVLWGLFRSGDNTKMMEFFRNNFSEDRWRRAALKNAFALLGRQRFVHAAAFFLLAGALRDAVEVCLNKLEDLQLALVITRLYEGDLEDSLPASLRRILHEECLGCDKSGENYSQSQAHPDPFLRSMAHWILKDYSSALGTLLENGTGHGRDYDSDEDNEMDSYSKPSVFNFYNYLRTHPLLVRQQLASAADKNKSSNLLLSGFSYGAHVSSGDKNITIVDKITPVERRLYFMTAHAHFKAGCPALALEVLSKLPEVVEMDNNVNTVLDKSPTVPTSKMVESGLWDENSGGKKQTVNDDDWSLSKPQAVDQFDWSQPVGSSSGQISSAGGFDWSTPIMGSRFDEEDTLELKFDDDDDDKEDSDTKSDTDAEMADKLSTHSSETANVAVESPSAGRKKDGVGDIMAQQLKFVACLKIMMEELSTLATGFEVDGGQLRYQLYIWLEEEVECLKVLCNYGQDVAEVALPTTADEKEPRVDDQKHVTSVRSDSTKLTLHEVIMAEKMDFEAKLERMAKRKLWLKTNQQLLRTLLSYSSLHGSCGGGLASVRMELILLLQELQQEKTQQQLLSPLPFPTTLPLLSASVASSRTFIADPVRHLQSCTQDILHTIVEFTTPPVSTYMLNQVFVLRNLSAALSACIYQCLCDSDNFVVAMSDNISIGMEGFTNHSLYRDGFLMSGVRKKRSSSAEDEIPNSASAKWPGVSSLRTLLARESDEDSPRLSVLLCESLVAVYMSLLIHALTMYDTGILYRLVAHPFTERIWPALFGGGQKKLVQVTNLADRTKAPAKDDLAKQRNKLNLKVMGHSSSTSKLKEGKPTYKEKFVPPDVSMVSYFMTKPYMDPDAVVIDYDSEVSDSSDDDEEEEIIGSRGKSDTAMYEHCDPNSYSWCLMRYAIVKYVLHTLKTFLPQVGLELPELPVCSPLLHATLNTLSQWEEMLLGRLELFAGPPDDYIPGCFVDSTVNGPAILKYKAMMESHNTPFLSNQKNTLPAKRLWHLLVRKEYLQDIFIRYIFKRKRPKHKEEDDSYKRDSQTDGQPPVSTDPPMKVIHKEHDVITSFCINQFVSPGTFQTGYLSYSTYGDTPTSSNMGNLHCVALATQKELIEMDISGIINPPSWLEDETEYDIEAIKNPLSGKIDPEDFIVVSTPLDKTGVSGTPTAPGVIPAPTSVMMSQTGRGASMIKGLNIPGITNPNYSYYIVDRSRRLMKRITKRSVPQVKRMGAHPHLPYYLSGSQDGSVKLWEWGHHQHISMPRHPGTHPKVTCIQFNAQGNKFGVTDKEGALSLWQLSLGTSMNKPYLNLKCHNKTTSDFAFVGSASLLATAGHSSENRNVCLWDTLLPQRNALVHAFNCHEHGSVAVLYAPQHQLLISGGKRGDVCIFDLRQRHLLHTFQAHEHAIKCMALDPHEEYFVTGSAEGNTKVWGLDVHNLMFSFMGEHAKSSLFRNIATGVSQITVSADSHLYSCGADGSIKVRKLPEKDTIVHSIY